jgi:hypothetical protein
MVVKEVSFNRGKWRKEQAEESRGTPAIKAIAKLKSAMSEHDLISWLHWPAWAGCCAIGLHLWKAA